MAVERQTKIRLAPLGWLAAVLFLAGALFSYSPGDASENPFLPLGLVHQPRAWTYPRPDVPQNLCGQFGAWLADALFSSVGIGAYYVLATVIAIFIASIRHSIAIPVIRVVGWYLSLCGLCVLAVLFFPDWAIVPLNSAGGEVGTLGLTILAGHFAGYGAGILAASMFCGGLLLATDGELIGVLDRWLTQAASGRWLTGLTGRRGRVRRAPIASESLAAENVRNVVAVRIGGRPIEGSVPLLESPLSPEDIAEAVADDSEDKDERFHDEDETDDEATANQSNRSSKSKRNKGKLTNKSPKAEPATKAAKGDPLPRPEDQRREVIEQLEQASLHEDASTYELPSKDLLLEAEAVPYEQQAHEVRRKAKILEKTFADFGYQVKVVEIETGPVIAQYEVELEAGLRLSKITGLADDLAIALRAPSVRIVAPIPGKNTVGIEVPNDQRQIVRLREVMEQTNGRIKKMRIPLFLGKDVSGNPLTVDLSSLPHLLIAGRTGTGKSVCLNAIIASMLMTRRPDEVRMLMIDPKMVELSGYKTLPHLMHPVVTDMRKAEAILSWAVDKMEERYALLARAGVRHIVSYNQLGVEELAERLGEDDIGMEHIPRHLPFIVIVADEIADLMMTSGKEVEQHIIRLAQKSRAVGIHLILATQKPTVDVITGLIKSNLPARIAFQVASRTDSRVVLDEMGADKLLGNGDMLFLWPGTSTLIRGQGTYLTDEEIVRIVNTVSTGEQHFVHELVELKVEDAGQEQLGALKKRDDLYETAVDIVVREGRGSVSLLQRALGIGYGRAARLIDFMAEDGIVGAYAGSQAREVTITPEQWEQMQSSGKGDATPGSAEQRILPLVNKHATAAGIDDPEDLSDDDHPSEEVDEEDWEEEDDSDEAGDDEEPGEDEEYDYEEEDYDPAEYEAYEDEEAEEPEPEPKPKKPNRRSPHKKQDVFEDDYEPYEESA